ncbi:Macrolide export ATP-binding/permease protein MacB [Bordetella tumbae]|uniref:MacB family efflux pump subunit n=1 Tax=Bordetella tumbae TaxID=1649139 RepID=UPI0039F07E6F
MSDALLQLRGLSRSFPAGDETLTVLKHLDLDIHAGEMVAIVGASGSGKSTLMNILGCLDRPTEGVYRVAGRETHLMSPDELAQLRREHFGFVFQRYHLLGDLNAQGNVEVPAVYAGQARSTRHARAHQLLARLKLADRIGHRPGQLSGGQQQRVSIARALMNGGQVILADEPTGALDSRSGEEVMGILQELHAQGHTIILVTHDMSVAQHAQRIIELHDGAMIADRENPSVLTSTSMPVRDAVPNVSRTDQHDEDLPAATAPRGLVTQLLAQWDRFAEAFRMALLAMNAHRLRTLLTMLGIVIGIASVVLVVALGKGTQEQVLSNINSLGTNTIDVYPGSGFGDMRSGKVQTLRATDAQALASQSYVDSVTPNVSTSVTARRGNISVTTQVYGVGDQYFRAKGLKIHEGAFFDAQAVDRIDRTVVIDPNTRAQLFPHGEDPIGQIILLGQVPCMVIGVTQKQTTGFGNSSDLRAWVPYTSVMSRMLGQSYLSSITVRVSDDTPMDAAAQAITKVLLLRHGTQDFFLNNTAEIRETIEKTTQTMTLMVGAIAMISLIVGGIGVMNIMLVSVTERTREIGVRMAVGARQSDIMQQFLIEAVVVCMLGGVLGVLCALSVGWLIHAGSGFSLSFSSFSIIAAFVCSSLIGVVFGFLPARNAAQLDPVEALARE